MVAILKAGHNEDAAKTSSSMQSALDAFLKDAEYLSDAAGNSPKATLLRDQTLVSVKDQAERAFGSRKAFNGDRTCLAKEGEQVTVWAQIRARNIAFVRKVFPCDNGVADATVALDSLQILASKKAGTLDELTDGPTPNVPPAAGGGDCTKSYATGGKWGTDETAICEGIPGEPCKWKGKMLRGEEHGGEIGILLEGNFPYGFSLAFNFANCDDNDGQSSHTIGPIKVDPAVVQMVNGRSLVYLKDVFPAGFTGKGCDTGSVVTTPLNSEGQADGQVCSLAVEVASPIVLNLDGKKDLAIADLSLFSPQFDLDADGIAETTAWVKSASFLAMDRNQNGRIDNGTELFGNFTRLRSGQKASNGYEALKELDQNKDSFIDSKDAPFQKLLVWTDRNRNGQSEKEELISLTDANITKIGLEYQTMKVSHKTILPTTTVKFESRFWGPKSCSKDGCYSYDIFFATSPDGAVTKR